jgi:hypothetical protein
VHLFDVFCITVEDFAVKQQGKHGAGDPVQTAGHEAVDDVGSSGAQF